MRWDTAGADCRRKEESAPRISRTRYRIPAKPVPGTAELRLDGATRAREILEIEREDPAIARPLVDDLPVSAAEVAYACRAEMAVSLVDVMLLRTRLSVLCADGGQGAVDRVEAVMARELGWEAAERRRQRARLERAVGQERAALVT